MRYVDVPGIGQVFVCKECWQIHSHSFKDMNTLDIEGVEQFYYCDLCGISDKKPLNAADLETVHHRWRTNADHARNLTDIAHQSIYNSIFGICPYDSEYGHEIKKLINICKTDHKLMIQSRLKQKAIV